MGDLAPRDVVARAIHQQIIQGRGAFLDARQAVGAHFPDEFPTVFAACIAGGIDPRTQPIPVAPAAHYHMGGVATDAFGQTTLTGLFAAGECAATGVHGANRLASNSLLEAAVFGTRAGAAARDIADPGSAPQLAIATPDLPAPDMTRLRRAMSRDAGVVRSAAGLSRLLGLADELRQGHGPAPSVTAAHLVAACALARRESRGAHFRADAEASSGFTPQRTFVTLGEDGAVLPITAADRAA
jgi:L-aspartate oxidase